jgi:hypothetical protein
VVGLTDSFTTVPDKRGLYASMMCRTNCGELRGNAGLRGKVEVMPAPQ